MDPFPHAQQLYAAGRVHDALEAAQSACERHPRDAERWWLLARISRHAGLEQASDVAFRRAADLSDRHPLPPRLTRARFRELVEAAADGDPAPAIEALPGADAIAAGTSPDALLGGGICYQTNVENRCRDEAEVAALLRQALAAATA